MIARLMTIVRGVYFKRIHYCPTSGVKAITGPPNGLEAVANVDLFINLVNVGFDCVTTNAKLIGYHIVCITGNKKVENLLFSQREVAYRFRFVYFIQLNKLMLKKYTFHQFSG